MSGGEKQRVKLAVALVGRPELVFLDEPTAGLDLQGRNVVRELIEQLREDGVTVVLTTHLMDDVERLADHVVIVDHGRTVAEAAPDALTGTADDVLTFRATTGLDVDALVAALPAGTRMTESPAGTYRVEGVVDADLFAAVSAWCAQQGVVPASLTAGHRSLEDVFLDLTGRELRA